MPCCHPCAKQPRRSSGTVKMWLFRGLMGATCSLPHAIRHSFLQDWVRFQGNHHLDLRNNVARLASCLPQRQLSRFIDVLFIKPRSFFQAASLLGYCVFPINVASFSMIFIESWLPQIFKLAIVVASFLWATMCKSSLTQPLSPSLARWFPQRRESWPSTQ